MSHERKPNIFDYATKELSQDAMICWLIRWADDCFADADRELHGCGRDFVGALLRSHGVETLPDRIETKIFQQDKGIDVLARISPDHLLLIEDKTGTQDHSGQLKRYYELVIQGKTKLQEADKENVYPIYLKTGNQPLYKDKKIEKRQEGFSRWYKVFNRTEFLDVLRTYKGNHQALVDYRDHLERWERSTNSFLKYQRTKWSWKSWEGFFRYLEEEHGFKARYWGYVSNKSGGFLCFEWNAIHVNGNGNGGPNLCLRLEVNPGKKEDSSYLLCFKVHNVAKAKQQKWKWRWHKRIIAVSRGRVKRPRVMRVGNTMTVGHWDGDWLAFSNGKINLADTIANLRKAEVILDRAFAVDSFP